MSQLIEIKELISASNRHQLNEEIASSNTQNHQDQVTNSQQITSHLTIDASQTPAYELFSNHQILIQNHLPKGLLITAFNYHRHSYFGGFFGKPSNHNSSMNCKYNQAALASLNLTPASLNQLFLPIYSSKVTKFYHFLVTLIPFLVLFKIVAQFTLGFVLGYEASQNHSPLNITQHPLYIVTQFMDLFYTIAFFIFLLPLYYFSLKSVEQLIIHENQQSFRTNGIRVIGVKVTRNSYLLCKIFKRIDALIVQKIE